ncbi:molybdopterin-containing oxidoreductase family protein [[Mycobacterium] nativiensis]|uniref:Molybdopterin-dependent oxidoreductase n=1 Tax=[Mycobacterium] nativiensis TaxID=2855503 RepID=A0ABU5XVA8_9MYCO|nr:molybdopterin-dependent oxidoreductase [Mycolicibacter sp. MYC340]MEB3031858.1 molybdopterin-dependent oxidoreductase [Mycolicibacter sp. MYC340]
MNAECVTQEKKTFCGICEASCGLIATVDGDTVTALRPDPDHPSSRGFACIKGLSFHAVVTDPDRVVEPMRRLPSGEFAPATWEEAFDDIGERLRAVQRSHGTESIGVAWGNPAAWNYTGTLAITGLASALKTKHHYSSASVDVNNYWVAADMMFGATTVNLLPDFAHTAFALIIGANPVVSHGSLVTTGRIRDVLRDIPKRGGRVVVVDPRRTETARLFEHVGITPGADAWLLGAMLRVLFDEDLIDVAELNRTCTGLDELRDLASRFDVGNAAAQTGIDSTVIVDLARSLAAAPSATVYGRCGASLGRHSTLTKFLLDTLAVVTGNIDRRGGMVFPYPMIDIAEMSVKSGQTSRGTWTTRVHGVPEVNGTAPIACLSKEITTAGRGQLRALITMSNNIVTSAPDSVGTAAALDELDFMVALDPYITETSKHADWVLPPALWLEREGFPVFTQGQATEPNAQWVAPVVPPRGQAREDWRIIDEIARRIGLVPSAAPGAQLLGRLGVRFTPMAAMDLLLRIGPHGDLFGLRRKGLSRKKLMATQGAVKLAECCPVGVLVDKLHTPDKRIRLGQPELIAEADLLTKDSDRREFPLRLFTIRELRSHNTWLHNVPRLMSGDRRCRAFVHPDIAAAKGVGAGDDIRITSPWGQIVVPVELDDAIAANAVGMTHGWGHSGGWTLATAAGGASYNALTPSGGDHIDRPSGNAFLNGIPVSIDVGH